MVTLLSVFGVLCVLVVLFELVSYGCYFITMGWLGWGWLLLIVWCVIGLSMGGVLGFVLCFALRGCLRCFVLTLWVFGVCCVLGLLVEFGCFVCYCFAFVLWVLVDLVGVGWLVVGFGFWFVVLGVSWVWFDFGV